MDMAGPIAKPPRRSARNLPHLLLLRGLDHDAARLGVRLPAPLLLRDVPKHGLLDRRGLDDVLRQVLVVFDPLDCGQVLVLLDERLLVLTLPPEPRVALRGARVRRRAPQP